MASKYWVCSHKYGIRMPKIVQEALLNQQNGKNYWPMAIRKEMTNNNIAFNILYKDQPVPIGYTITQYHEIFDVKFYFTWKARFVEGSHLTDTPSSLTYSTVTFYLVL